MEGLGVVRYLSWPPVSVPSLYKNEKDMNQISCIS